MTNWDEIQREWETSKITLAALAEKHDVKLGTLKSRKSREAWVRGSSKKDATRKKKVATPSKRMQPKKKDKEPVVESDNLTDKQRLFCIYYIKYFNATKAYQKAYECDYMTANANGSRLLVNASIRDEVVRMKKERASGLLLSADAVLQKYIDIAFADISDFMTFGSEEVVAMDEYGKALIDDKGEKVTYMRNYVTFMNSDEVDGTLITEVKQGKDGVSVKLADKMKALDFLSRHFDMLSGTQKEQLAMEKDKVAIAKVNAEIEKLSGNNDDGPIEIMITRKGDR